MAGGEDTNPHDKPASSTPTPDPTSVPEPEGSVPLKKTGEIMLGFALSIIFIVIFCVIIHLLLKQHRQKYPNGKKKKKKKQKKDLEAGTSELHSIDKKIYEAGGTEVVLCELPEEAPPRHEMDAGFVFPFSPLERTMTGTTEMTGTTSSEMIVSPESAVPPEDPFGRRMAVYWQTR
jgi:hypothetical protein